jgi:hypothetical protein
MNLKKVGLNDDLDLISLVRNKHCWLAVVNAATNTRIL